SLPGPDSARPRGSASSPPGAARDAWRRSYYCPYPWAHEDLTATLDHVEDIHRIVLVLLAIHPLLDGRLPLGVVVELHRLVQDTLHADPRHPPDVESVLGALVL